MAAYSRFAGRTTRALLTALAMSVVMAPGAAMAAQLTASWVDNSDGAANTRVERRRATEQVFTAVADVPPGATSFVDASVSPSTTYCYRVAAWVAEDVSPYTDEVCATSAAEPLSVTVTKAGPGTGAVTSSPAGINCGATCSAAFNAGTSVTLAATPATGSTFSGWSGSGCAGTAPCVVAGNAPVSVTATFSLVPSTTAPPPTTSPTLHKLTVTKSGIGTVASAPVGIKCGSICSASFAGGTTVKLVAASNGSSRFAGWSGACAGTATSCTITMNAAASVTAKFTPKK